VLKRSPAEGLAAQAVAEGGTYLDPAVVGAVVGPGAGADADLSGREVQVLRFLVRGYSAMAIAAKLVLSAKTPETYKARSREKLHVGTRVYIVRYADECGWLGATCPSHWSWRKFSAAD
jgi:DNA-binding NarL/FixJ family response regulator